MAEHEIETGESEGIASLVREHLAKRRLTRAGLADTAKISLSTLEKALSGQRPFTLATVVRLEEALGLSLRNGGQGRNGLSVAPDWLGSYARPSVQWLEGMYVTIRPSFSQEGAVYTYLTEIHWDAAHGHLAFRESERRDANYKQIGRASCRERVS
jgi:DNA-binding phage protein